MKQLFKPGKQYVDENKEIITNIVSRMEIILRIPEFKFCQQNEKFVENGPNDNLIFIAKGKCVVYVEDQFGDRRE
jgi:hypothetical protein